MSAHSIPWELFSKLQSRHLLRMWQLGLQLGHGRQRQGSFWEPGLRFPFMTEARGKSGIETRLKPQKQRVLQPTTCVGIHRP